MIEAHHMDWLLDVFIGVAMLFAVGVFAWVWFRWDSLNELDKHDGNRKPDKFEDPFK